MDTKKLTVSDLDDILYRFSVMRDRAAEVVELAQEVSDVLDDIERTKEILEDAQEENDHEEVKRCLKDIEESEKNLEKLKDDLDHQFFCVQSDFCVNDVDDLL